MHSYNQTDKYIQKLLEIQEERNQAIISASNQKEIAMEMGLSEEDWRAVQETADQHIERGNGFAKFENWTDAIDEFEHAKAIRPDGFPVLYGLAYAHSQRWRKKRNEEDRELARKFAVQCLQIDPNHAPSFELINLLKQRTTFGALQMRNLVIAGLLCLTAFLGYKAFQIPSVEVVDEPVSVVDDPKVLESSIPSSGQYQTKTIFIDEGEVKVDFLLNENSNGLGFQLDEVDFSSFQETFTFDINGNFDLKEMDVSDMRIKFTLYNNKNQIITEGFKHIWKKDLHPIARKGDQLPFGLVEFDKHQAAPILSRVEMGIISIDQFQGATAYEEGEALPYYWSIQQPKNVDIKLLARKNNLDFAFFSSGLKHDINYELTNTGKEPIKSMDARIDYKKKDGTTISTKLPMYLLLNFQPELKPGQTRIGYLNTTQFDFQKEELESFEIVITQIDF